MKNPIHALSVYEPFFFGYITMDHKTQNFAQHEFLTDREACELLRRSRVWLFQKRKEGELPFYRLGGSILYKRDELIEFANRNRQPAIAAVAA